MPASRRRARPTACSGPPPPPSPGRGTSSAGRRCPRTGWCDQRSRPPGTSRSRRRRRARRARHEPVAHPASPEPPTRPVPRRRAGWADRRDRRRWRPTRWVSWSGAQVPGCSTVGVGQPRNDAVSGAAQGWSVYWKVARSVGPTRSTTPRTDESRFGPGVGSASGGSSSPRVARRPWPRGDHRPTPP